MNKQAINTFIKGINKDIDKSIMSKDSYLHADNFRIVTSKGSSSGALENVKGNKIINESLPFEDGQFVCGSVRLRDYLIIFTTNNTTSTPNGGRSMIYKATVDRDTEELTTLDVLYDDSLNNSTGTLNFSTANIIKAVSLYETTTTQKVYWTDNYSNLRYADVAKNLTINGESYSSNNYMAPEMFELLPLFTSSKPALDNIINGHLYGGVVQYAYQLYKLNGASTAFSPVSDMIHIVNDGDFRTTTLGYGGDGESLETGKGCKISIENDNIGYNRLRLVRIHYTTLNSIPTINVASEIEIDVNPSTVYISDIGDNVSSLTLDEFNILSTELFKAEDIAIKDNRLFVANIERDEFTVDNFDPRAVRYKYGYAVLTGNTPTLIVEHGYNSIVFTQLSDNLIGVTVPDLSTIIGSVPLSVYDSTLTGNIYGQYTDIYGFSHVYSSLSTDTSIYDVSYNTGTDVLTFKILNLAGIYFEFPVLSFDSGGTNMLSFEYTYYSATPTLNAAVRDGSNVLTIDAPTTDTIADWDSAGWSDYVATHDGINDFNDVDNDADTEYAYKYQSDGITLGAEGPNVKIDFETETIILDNSNSDTTFSTTIESGGSYTNFASPWKGGELSWQRDETYRLFVEWKDNRGRRSYPQWITDLRMPSFHDDSFTDSESNTHQPYILADYDSNVVYTRVLRPRIYFKHFPDNAVSCQIYRVKRDRSDRSIITQGLGIPTTYDGLNNAPHSIEENIQAAAGIELVKIVSPEINITKNVSKQSSDYIEYVTNFSTVTKTTSSTDSVNRTTFKFLENARVAYADGNLANVNDAISISPAVDLSADDYITIDGKLYCNYHPGTLGEPGGKGATGLLISYDNSVWNAEGVQYVIINYRSKVFGSQYGGNTYEARTLNVSVPCSDVIDTTDRWYSIKYGDTFINYFDVSTILYDLTLTDIGDSQSEVAYVPLESSINCDLRHDTSAQHLEYNIINSALRQEYPGLHTFVGASEYTYNQTLDLYLYNTVYSQQPSVQNAISEILDIPTETKFDCLIKASNVKHYGELSDSWTKFNLNEEIEVDSHYSEVRAISNVNDKLLFWQEDGFGMLSVNDRSLIQDNSSSQLVLGTGGVLDRYDYISTSVGILNKFTLVHTDSSVYWFYDKDTSIYIFNNQLSNLTKSKGMWSWFRNNYSDEYDVHGIYDREYNEVLYTLYSDSIDGYTLAYNEQTEQFTSFYDFVPRLYIDLKDKYCTVRENIDTSEEDIFEVNYGLLYNWYAATDVREIAADGWHVPTEAEIITFYTFLDAAVAGGKCKETGLTYWFSPNTGATNETGFNGRGSGIRIYNTGVYSNMLSTGNWWLTTPHPSDPSMAYTFNFSRSYALINNTSNGQRNEGMAIRLIKDSTTLSDGEGGSYTGNDGKVYRTICIGTQEWLADNLAETKFRNGDDIPEVTDAEDWVSLVTAGMCAYDNNWANAYDGITVNYSSLYIHNSNIEPRCTFYESVFPSTIKILYNDDYAFTKVFDNIFYISNAFDEDTDVDQYNITFDRLRCYDDYQNSDWVTLTYPTNIMRRERGWTAVVPRNKVEAIHILSPNIFTPVNIDSDATKVYSERIRDKYMVLDLSFDNESETRFVVPFIGIKYRLSYR